MPFYISYFTLMETDSYIYQYPGLFLTNNVTILFPDVFIVYVVLNNKNTFNSMGEIRSINLPIRFRVLLLYCILTVSHSSNLNSCQISWHNSDTKLMYFAFFIYPVTLLSNIPYLHSAVSLIEDEELLSCSGVWLDLCVCVCVCVCLSLCCWCVCRVARQDVRSIL